MSKHIHLGTDLDTGVAAKVPRASFNTHWHLIGATGKGKTVSILTLLNGLLTDPFHPSCFFIIDRMGGFSFDLLRWFASPYCPKWVRERLLYVDPAREDVVLGFNPLLYDTPGHGYFKTSRATEIILRGWESVNIEAMPRLARWTFNTFWAAAQLGLTIADTVHLLLPHSDIRPYLLSCLPPQLQFEWQEISQTSANQMAITLDSTRNRLKPFWESPILRCTFGATTNRFDVLRFMREGRIVLVNLAPKNRLSDQTADAIGGLIINEILSVARSQPPGQRYDTYLVLDEFQRFVGPDLEMAIPEVRQLGIKLLLSHQSFSQLLRGQYDLSSLIWQCQNRLMFGVQAEDADLLADEIATVKYDPWKIKEEIYHRKQLTTGHSIIELSSRSTSDALADQWSKSIGDGWSRPENWAPNAGTHNENTCQNQGGSKVRTSAQAVNQALLPVYERFLELASRTYFTFEEQRVAWGKEFRTLKTGQALLQLVNDPERYRIAVKRVAPGDLALDWPTVMRQLPKVADEVDRLIEANFAQDVFTSPAEIERETQERLRRVLQHVPEQGLPFLGLRCLPKEPKLQDGHPSSDDSLL